MVRCAFVVLFFIVVSCGQEGERVEETSSPSSGEDAVEQAPAAGGTLRISGNAIESPGTHDVEVSCQYGGGTFTLSAYGQTSDSGNLSVTAGDRSAISFEDGTYPARFSYDEPRSDGRVLSYSGQGEVTIEVVDESGSFPVARVTARGTDGGMEFELAGRCATLGAG